MVMDALKKIFGLEPSPDLTAMIKNGAVILDVRSKGEYAGGHVKGSINIPVDQLESRISQLPKNKAIITCCASGMRSSTAKSILQSRGFSQVVNGGSWYAVQSKMK
jgi:rhodanese-related sulfurtransferase